MPLMQWVTIIKAPNYNQKEVIHIDEHIAEYQSGAAKRQLA